jgi:N-acetylmuramoyl-L-alanine amidase
MKVHNRIGGAGVAALGLILSAASLCPTSAQPQAPRITVVIDAGHGGIDAGARGTGKNEGVHEKDVNLAVAKALRATLVKQGITVRMTRDNDTFLSLSDRTKAAAKENVTCFLSIHADTQQKGKPPVHATVYHHDQERVSRSLAAAIARQAGQALPTAPVGVHSDTTVFPKGFAVLRQSASPAVLVDLGEMTALKETKVQQRVAESIAKGLQDFLAAKR